MKNIIKIVFFLLLGSIGITNYSKAYDAEWFDTYQEKAGRINFSCTKWCIIVVGEKESINTITISGTINGNGEIWYKYATPQNAYIGQHIWCILQWKKTFLLKQDPIFNQLPNTTKIGIVVNGTCSWFLQLEHTQSTFWNTLLANINQVTNYVPYKGSTINFIKWPSRNGQYINSILFIPYLIIFIICINMIILTNKKKIMLIILIGTTGLRRIINDTTSTINEVHLYKNITQKTIMNNGRLGDEQIFYAFLENIKKEVPKWNWWTVDAGYPYDIEGTFHLYPRIKIPNTTTKDIYIFTYNLNSIQNTPASDKQIEQKRYGTIQDKKIWKQNGIIYHLKRIHD